MAVADVGRIAHPRAQLPEGTRINTGALTGRRRGIPSTNLLALPCMPPGARWETFGGVFVRTFIDRHRIAVGW